MITWVTPAGSLGLLTERIIIDIPLSATSDVGPVTYSLIAGFLPRGLRLSNGSIKGSPTEVKVYTESKFVIRASDGEDIEDRTFTLAVDGSDRPIWLTREGFLNVGPAEAYFILDNAQVDFQLEARDTDLIAGDRLEFYLVPNGGLLPPGLTLSRDGVISGFTDPIFSVEYLRDPSGGYDTTPLDVFPLDYVEARSNGFDTFFYDTQTFDYNEPSRLPKRLSRIYNFVVAVTDGVYTETRLFKIYVVTEEFLKADNSIVQVDTNLFQADSSSNRTPIWITESNLGRFRANNYVTIFLDVYDPPTLSGTITYFLLSTNFGTYRLKNTNLTAIGNYELSNRIPSFNYNLRGDWNSQLNYKIGDAVTFKDNEDSTIRNRVWICKTPNINVAPTESSFWTKQNVSTGSQTFQFTDTALWETLVPETVSEIPPGMELDSITGEIAGRVPYQARVTKSYSFTMRAVNFPSILANTKYTLQGEWNSTIAYAVNDAVIYLGLIYISTVANRNKLPTNTDFWTAGVSSSDKTFTVEIVGEIESAVNWLTDSDLGTIKPNQPSQKFVEAESLLYGGRVGYEWVSGTLPPGLIFYPTGIIEGKVKQFADSDGPGLIRFYEKDSSTEDSASSRDFSSTFDGGTTTFDKKFTFTIRARDSVNFAVVDRTFNLTVIADNTKTFANIYIKAFQSKNKRLAWYNFITDATIFKPSDMYRYGDRNFGIQTSLQLLVYAGIESVEAVRYIQAMSRNHYRKRMYFGDLKVAKAKDPITQETVYEVIYADVIDDYEKNGASISSKIELSDTIKSKVLISYDSIKVDSDIPFVSDSDHQRIFPNSIKNMRNRIKEVGDRDREFLPLWMRSIQDQATFETGYTKALILCYCNPGSSAAVLSRIRASNFDFKTIDFQADRYIIDIIDGQIEDKYLAFPQRGEKLP